MRHPSVSEGPDVTSLLYIERLAVRSATWANAARLWGEVGKSDSRGGPCVCFPDEEGNFLDEFFMNPSVNENNTNSQIEEGE